MSAPVVIIIGGPNGAGKTTAAPSLVRDLFGMSEYVNADTIAAGLSAFDPDRAAFAAGRIMLARLKDLARQRRSFAFETTLASRTFAPWLKSLIDEGYECHLIYFWLASPELAIERVRTRVRAGGHDVPGVTVRRRYIRGARNLLTLYVPLCRTWQIYDNSREDDISLVAECRQSGERILQPGIWNAIHQLATKAHE